LFLDISVHLAVITYLHRRLKSWFTLGEYSPTLFTYPKHEFHIRLIGLVNQTGFGQVPLPFGRLLRQNVTFKSMLPFDFTRSSKSESFFGTGIGLYFWHNCYFTF